MRGVINYRGRIDRAFKGSFRSDFGVFLGYVAYNIRRSASRGSEIRGTGLLEILKNIKIPDLMTVSSKRY